MLWRLSFKFFREWTVILRSIPSREVFHFGFGNRCKDGRYLLFLDYDDSPMEFVKEEIELLQDMSIVLGNAYIFKTKHGIHVLFLEKMSITQVIRYMHETTIDQRYRDVPMLYAKKVWVLRQSEKKNEHIEYVGCIKRPSTIIKSFAHREYMRRFMNVPVKDLPHEHDCDGETSIVLGYYKISPDKN